MPSPFNLQKIPGDKEILTGFKKIYNIPSKTKLLLAYLWNLLIAHGQEGIFPTHIFFLQQRKIESYDSLWIR